MMGERLAYKPSLMRSSLPGQIDGADFAVLEAHMSINSRTIDISKVCVDTIDMTEGCHRAPQSAPGYAFAAIEIWRHWHPCHGAHL